MPPNCRHQVTKAMEGTASGTIFALYPHQWKYTRTPLTAMNYRSVRGTMKIGTGSGFQTMVPIQGVPALATARSASRAL